MFKHKSLRLFGQKTAYFTAEIIKKFNPEFWCIENGSSSLIFKYLNKYCNLNGNQNKTYYSSYDNINFGRKPTTIYSNLKMNLRDDFRKSNIHIAYCKSSIKNNKQILTNYCERSRVPIDLYNHILEIFEGKQQLSMF